jgi:hypothetical protein
MLSTTPAPSCPKIAGNNPSGSEAPHPHQYQHQSISISSDSNVVPHIVVPSPESVNLSVWQTPVAFNRMRTSPALGGATSTRSIAVSDGANASIRRPTELETLLTTNADTQWLGLLPSNRSS